MTRRRFYASPQAFASDAKSVTLTAEETRHLRDVLRLKSGEEVYVFDGRGREVRGTVQSITRDSTEVSVGSEVDPAQPESPLRLTLAVALLKGEKFDLVMQKATELGVARVIPVITARADVKLRNDDDAERKLIRWRRIALEATKQCGRARLMDIENPVAFDNLIVRPKGDQLRLMFSERDGTSLATAVGETGERRNSVIAIVGSEGGWTDEEIDQAGEAEWKIVTLGGRILRAETAAIVVAALLQHRFGDLS
ncbi:MAG TPA: 16S rRNA (uracil(1498)-N(3))-methyltransferase [Pyrinomonadaceae bacterium]|nr:16S rRNA (uracil(1498)-N(3))-methyltransferase [Pyrinomonadaceae bacterium]